jgi:hypothetical protein
MVCGGVDLSAHQNILLHASQMKCSINQRMISIPVIVIPVFLQSLSFRVEMHTSKLQFTNYQQEITILECHSHWHNEFIYSTPLKCSST